MGTSMNHHHVQGHEHIHHPQEDTVLTSLCRHCRSFTLFSVTVDHFLSLSGKCVCVCVLSRIQLFCEPMDCSSPGSSVHGSSQARILEWVAISFSRGSSYPGIEPTSLPFPALAGVHKSGIIQYEFFFV